MSKKRKVSDESGGFLALLGLTTRSELESKIQELQQVIDNQEVEAAKEKEAHRKEIAKEREAHNKEITKVREDAAKEKERMTEEHNAILQDERTEAADIISAKKKIIEGLIQEKRKAVLVEAERQTAVAQRDNLEVYLKEAAKEQDEMKHYWNAQIHMAEDAAKTAKDAAAKKIAKAHQEAHQKIVEAKDAAAQEIVKAKDAAAQEIAKAHQEIVKAKDAAAQEILKAKDAAAQEIEEAKEEAREASKNADLSYVALDKANDELRKYRLKYEKLQADHSRLRAVYEDAKMTTHDLISAQADALAAATVAKYEIRDKKEFDELVRFRAAMVEHEKAKKEAMLTAKKVAGAAIPVVTGLLCD